MLAFLCFSFISQNCLELQGSSTTRLTLGSLVTLTKVVNKTDGHLDGLLPTSPFFLIVDVSLDLQPLLEEQSASTFMHIDVVVHLLFLFWDNEG